MTAKTPRASKTPLGKTVQIWPVNVEVQEVRTIAQTNIRWLGWVFPVALALDFAAWVEEHRAELEQLDTTAS